MFRNLLDKELMDERVTGHFGQEKKSLYSLYQLYFSPSPIHISRKFNEHGTY